MNPDIENFVAKLQELQMAIEALGANADLLKIVIGGDTVKDFYDVRRRLLSDPDFNKLLFFHTTGDHAIMELYGTKIVFEKREPDA